MADKTAVIKETQKYLAKGQIDKAIAEWEIFAKESPDGNTYNVIGDLHLRKGDRKSAVKFFHKAAGSFRKEGFGLKTFAVYKKIINIDPEDADALTELAELSEERGLVTEAIKYLLNAADILSKSADKSRLQAIYERVLSLSPFNLNLRDKVAGFFLKQGNALYAAREYLYIARLCLDRKDTETAGAYFKKAFELQPDNRDALLGMASLHENSGDIIEALQYTEKAIKAHPEDAILLLQHASLLKKTGAYDAAIGTLTSLLELNPSDTEVQRLIGDIHLSKGDKQEALESYKAAVDSLSRENKPDKAIELALRFRDMDPVAAGKVLITLYRQNNDLKSAFEETIFVADLFSGSGSHNEALDYYKEALNLQPDNKQLRDKVSEQEMMLGIKSPDSEKKKTTTELLIEADIFIRYGLYDEARPILEYLKMRERTNADVHTRLKSFYLEMDDTDQAVIECIILAEIYGRANDAGKKKAVLEEALTIKPGDLRVQERLSSLSAD